MFNAPNFSLNISPTAVAKLLHIQNRLFLRRAGSLVIGHLFSFSPIPFLMDLLDQLWDDTVAGPRPESVFGKLRKHSTFSGRPGSGSKELDGGSARSYGDDSSQSSVRITRSIMIVRPPGYQSGSPPISPAGSSSPASPFSGRESFRFRRRSISDAYTKAADGGLGSPSSPHNM